MRNFLTHNDSKFCLIGKINGLSVESKKARKRILSAKNESAVCSFAGRKRIIGLDIRHHLLAYALLRGTPYSDLERNCREDNKPNAESILKIIQVHVANYFTIDIVNAWLKGE